MTSQELSRIKELATKNKVGNDYNLDKLSSEEKAEMVWIMVKEFFIKYNI